MENNKVVLLILDGWGHGKNPAVSAIAQANTPFIDSLYDKYPNSELTTYGELVGLPEGQMGNSEVGHLNIGAGRIVFQELARINNAIDDRSFYQLPILLERLKEAREKDVAVHLIGLVSNGGVHSHINHLKALCEIVHDNIPEKAYIHAFTDGRDVDPKSGLEFISDLESFIKDKCVKLATVTGRYYAMDRDKRWERIKLAYDALVNGKGKKTFDFAADIQASYDEGITDEFIQPLIKTINNQPLGTIKDGDLVICFNFRTDRPRQISDVLTQRDFPTHDMKKLDVHYITMTQYDAAFKGIDVLYTKENLSNTLGEVISNAGLSQVRIAETEKYPHVTYFFSGGREEEFPQESRIMIPSPKVATYDLQPSMSANELTEEIIKKIKSDQPNFVCLNYANTDMVGHTGIFKAAVQAAETVDQCVKQLTKVALSLNYKLLVIADHGNSDIMKNEDGSAHTAHTTNMVPCFLISNTITKKLKSGKLADVAPTILSLMNVAAPKEMTGKSLL